MNEDRMTRKYPVYNQHSTVTRAEVDDTYEVVLDNDATEKDIQNYLHSQTTSHS